MSSTRIRIEYGVLVGFTEPGVVNVDFPELDGIDGGVPSGTLPFDGIVEDLLYGCHEVDDGFSADSRELLERWAEVLEDQALRIRCALAASRLAKTRVERSAG